MLKEADDMQTLVFQFDYNLYDSPAVSYTSQPYSITLTCGNSYSITEGVTSDPQYASHLGTDKS